MEIGAQAIALHLTQTAFRAGIAALIAIRSASLHGGGTPTRPDRS